MPLRGLYATTLITEKDVIPAKAGIQENTGFPRIKYEASSVKPGMTNHTGPIYDDLVKSLKAVTPAEAVVQNYLNLLDSRFRENDKIGEIKTFYETMIYHYV